MGPRLPAVLRQIDRVPNLIKGIFTAGSVSGGIRYADNVKIKDKLEKIFYGGKNLREYEKSIIIEISSKLNQESIFRDQIDQVNFVQIFHKYRMVHMYFKENMNCSVFSNGCVVEVGRVYWEDVSSKGECSLILNNGLLSSLEFSHSPKSCQFLIRRVTVNLSNDKIPSSFDEFEHKNSSPSYSSDSSSPSTGSSGTVHVNGYFRKNGKYVHSYTRRK